MKQGIYSGIAVILLTTVLAVSFAIPKRAEAVIPVFLDGAIPPILSMWFKTMLNTATAAASLQTIVYSSGITSVQTTATAVRTFEDWLEEFVLTRLKKMLLDFLVSQIITYIQGNNDGAGFITDFEAFLSGAAAEVVSKAGIEYLGVDLCQNFDIHLTINQTFATFQKPRFRCTLRDIVANVESFKNNFQNGGWLAYTESWKPMNNPIGGIITTTFELEGQIARSQGAKWLEAQVGQGFLGGRDANGLIKLPGKTLGDLVSKAVGTDIDFLLTADQLGSYVNAIVDAMVNRVLKEGLATIRPAIGSSNDDFATRRPCKSGSGTHCIPNVNADLGLDYTGFLNGTIPDEELRQRFDGYLNDIKDRISNAIDVREKAEAYIANSNFATILSDAAAARGVIAELKAIFNTIVKADLVNPGQCGPLNKMDDVDVWLDKFAGIADTVEEIIALLSGAIDDDSVNNPDISLLPPAVGGEWSNPADQNADIIARLKAALALLENGGVELKNTEVNRIMVKELSAAFGAATLQDANDFYNSIKGATKELAGEGGVYYTIKKANNLLNGPGHDEVCVRKPALPNSRFVWLNH